MLKVLDLLWKALLRGCGRKPYLCQKYLRLPKQYSQKPVWQLTTLSRWNVKDVGWGGGGG